MCRRSVTVTERDSADATKEGDKMSRLKSTGYGDGRTTGAMPNGDYMSRENGDHSPSGISIQGVHYGLAGQPPIATTKGWGNLGFLMSLPYAP